MELAKNQGEEQKMKHPPGLYMLFMVEMWERFSYYGMRALLVMYLTGTLVSGGLGFDKASAMSLYGTFTSLVYLTPLVGGYLSDRFLGQRLAITIGGITMAAGQFALFSSQTKGALYLGLFLLIIGNGFFKPNISAIVGQLYPDGDKRKDAAFTIFYMGINVGAFIAPLVCGTLAEQVFAVRQGGEIIHYGFRYGFLAAAIGMILGQLIFNLLGNKYLGEIGKKPVKKAKDNDDNSEDANRPLTKKEKDRTIVIFILTAFVIFFWTGFEQAGSSLTIYTKDFIDRNAFGTELPVSWFQSLNPVFIVIFAPIIGKLWISLAKRPQGDMNIPTKMASGMILLGIGFVLMVGAVLQRGDAGDNVAVKANMLWLVGAYWFHTIGELCLSPVGLSMVSRLAPKKFLSLLMGVWLLSSSIANKLAGVLAGFMDQLGHLQIFGGVAVAVILCGGILLALNKKLSSMME
ncbi:peptide MFS transporter [Clostridium sp. CX1]|uniref:peptide MFS transporter n=1 Tax=Clostridium sp. CX1 TaxID=2978346 RepID=UPI0021C08534|nr:peptide MFS transporter [Clostridium sp. CX1]MCT8976367.1 peptide MFS transporter [Clostridium sp. CX1]